MNVIGVPLLERFLKLAGERLRGDWVVIGGCVLPLRGVEHRITLDIDVAGPERAGMRDTLLLLEMAEELGLPVEAINQAGALFLRRIPDWESNLLEIHRGPAAVIHVPDATLFLLLKINRLSEVDLDDCVAMLDLARDRREPIDVDRITQRVTEALQSEPSSSRAQRLRILQNLLN